MKRFLIDDDGCNLLGNLGPDVEGQIAEVVQECPANVTTYLVCVNGGTCFWNSKVGTMRPFPGLIEAHRRGVDPMRLWLQQLKAAGKETFLTVRMNDVHNPTEDWNIPEFRRRNPDSIVGLDEVRAGKASWMSYCMDYKLPEVRQHMLDLLRELVGLYGDVIDGIQLDWMRFPRHLSGTPEQVWDQREVLTQFMVEARRVISGGQRPILLGARVPTHPDGCRALGVDLQAWGERRLVDLLVICPFLTTDWQLPVADIRALLNNRDIPVYSGFDLAYGPQVHYPESLRGICTSLYDDQPDGLYLFNFPCWIERLAARPYHWLAGLHDPVSAAAKPMVLSVNHQRSRVARIDQSAQIPVTVAPGGQVTLKLHVPRAALPAWRAMAHIDTGGFDLQLQVNGTPAPLRLARDYGGGAHRSEIFVEFVNHYRPKTLRSGPADCRQFRVDVKSLRSGDNDLTFTNPDREERRLERLSFALW
jgi:hypothetical protein